MQRFDVSIVFGMMKGYPVGTIEKHVGMQV